MCAWLKPVAEQKMQSLRNIDDRLRIGMNQTRYLDLHGGILEALPHVYRHVWRLFPSLLNDFRPFVLHRPSSELQCGIDDIKHTNVTVFSTLPVDTGGLPALFVALLHTFRRDISFSTSS